jgi:selenide,water dikinase
VVVVGAGAAGVELAFCLEARLRIDTGRAPRVTLVDAGDRMLSGAPRALARRVARAAMRRGLGFRGGALVTAIEGTELRFAGGTALEADAIVWAPGPAAPELLGRAGLPLDERGFVRVQETLQVEGHPTLFAVGDCASLPGMQKAGVYAVRAAPVLAANLRSFCAGTPLRRFRPQAEFLSLLNLGDGSAVGVKRGVAFQGRWVMSLKDHIDRRFVARYR